MNCTRMNGNGFKYSYYTSEMYYIILYFILFFFLHFIPQQQHSQRALNSIGLLTCIMFYNVGTVAVDCCGCHATAAVIILKSTRSLVGYLTLNFSQSNLFVYMFIIFISWFFLCLWETNNFNDNNNYNYNNFIIIFELM